MAIIRPKNVPVSNLSGTLTNAQLPTLDYSILPPGSVIQTQHYRYDTNADSYDTIGEQVLALSPLVATFTPRFASSKLHIKAAMHVRVITPPGITFGINRDGVALDGMVNRNGKDFFYKGDSVNHHYTTNVEAYVDAGSISPTTFRVWGQGWGSGTWEISYGHGEHCITVMEIKQ